MVFAVIVMYLNVQLVVVNMVLVQNFQLKKIIVSATQDGVVRAATSHCVVTERVVRMVACVQTNQQDNGIVNVKALDTLGNVVKLKNPNVAEDKVVRTVVFVNTTASFKYGLVCVYRGLLGIVAKTPPSVKFQCAQTPHVDQTDNALTEILIIVSAIQDM